MNPPLVTLPSIQTVARRIGTPIRLWGGNCYAVACALIKHEVVEGDAIYGHWTGPIALKSTFAARRELGFCRHGWIEHPSGRIIDPTRFVFEAAKPYIYVGRNDYYDEGGEQLRAALQRPAPEPGVGKPVTLTLPPATETFVRELLGAPTEPFTMPMLGWLANCPLTRLGTHAAPLFAAIIASGHSAFIPVDNRHAVERRTRQR